MKRTMIFAALAAVTLSPAVLAREPVRQLQIGLDGIDLTTHARGSENSSAADRSRYRRFLLQQQRASQR